MFCGNISENIGAFSKYLTYWRFSGPKSHIQSHFDKKNLLELRRLPAMMGYLSKRIGAMFEVKVQR
jgi:hypothetical protein